MEIHALFAHNCHLPCRCHQVCLCRHRDIGLGLSMVRVGTLQIYDNSSYRDAILASGWMSVHSKANLVQHRLSVVVKEANVVLRVRRCVADHGLVLILQLFH